MSAWTDLLSGGLLGGVGDAVSSAIGGIVSAVQQKKEQQFEAEEAQKARDFNAAEADKNRQWQTDEREATQEWNLAQWERENEYNSPEAQLERMLAAGINPNSAVGQIGGNNNQSGTVRTSPQSGGAASGPAASGPSIAGNLADLIGNSLNTMWQNADLMAGITGKNITNSRLAKQLDAQINQIESQIAKNYSDVDVNDQNIEESKTNVEFTKANTDKVREEINVLKQKTPLELQAMALTNSKIMTEMRLIISQTDKTEAETQKIGQDIKESEARIENLSHENNKLIAEAAKIYAEKNNIEVDTVVKSINAVMQQRRNELEQQGIFLDANELVGGLLYGLSGNDPVGYYEPYLNFYEGKIAKDYRKERKLQSAEHDFQYRMMLNQFRHSNKQLKIGHLYNRSDMFMNAAIGHFNASPFNPNNYMLYPRDVINKIPTPIVSFPGKTFSAAPATGMSSIFGF